LDLASSHYRPLFPIAEKCFVVVTGQQLGECSQLNVLRSKPGECLIHAQDPRRVVTSMPWDSRQSSDAPRRAALADVGQRDAGWCRRHRCAGNQAGQ
jgi:hypothetical protein